VHLVRQVGVRLAGEQQAHNSAVAVLRGQVEPRAAVLPRGEMRRAKVRWGNLKGWRDVRGGAGCELVGTAMRGVGDSAMEAGGRRVGRQTRS
jgi:hypothetical protein